MASSSSSYPIWLITYGEEQNQDDHQALFTVLERNGGAKGSLLHVQGPDEDPLAERVSMWFELREDYRAFDSPTYKGMGIRKLVGTVDKGKYKKLLAICKSTQPPVIPQEHHPKKPNCRSWINNVLYQCKQERVVNFESSFDVPSEEEQLRV